ncbi:MAG: GyrI-like domain-containing protein [Rhizobiales bacterium]|nr:GyrI-like domain-containing protein [Hyphomicrobiales bacterium]
MEKLDFRKTMKALWQPPVGRFTIVDVPKMQFAMVDGKGDPNVSEDYKAAVQWLYGVSYALKFASKRELGRDYTVAPLEGLWWADDMADFVRGDKSRWQWTMMIMQPDWIARPMFDAAVARAREKLGTPPPGLRLEDYDEGLSVQVMHVGPYSAEGPTLARLHGEFLPANGLKETGRHHEIYIGDPRRTAPEKLKTVLRQPVRRL